MDKTLDTIKTEAEIGKLMAETSKLNAETSKLNAEMSKLMRETRWYPILWVAALVSAVSALSKVFH
ncbi:hypothetical protein [Pandoraea sputorum]|uniref:Uncharacterized protein n=1 Tax=Pandoraea sputorum TaxID=93222 RepID=A0A5E5BC84_9BURK|nr:hypothetical protein [Pandoraea sputorum]VVE82807.1 hypothetical protein PSP31121_03977 [Pandoraea sputorum]